MRHKGMTATFVALALALQGTAWAQQPAPPEPQANVETGKAIFTADGCFECHGRAGQGSRTTGPALARTQLPMDAFIEQLRHPSNEMPPYEPGVVSNQDAADIYAFLQSLPPAKNPKDIPLLNQ